MPMIKASKIWNKLSLSPSVILVKHPVSLCLNPPSITGMHIHVDKYTQEKSSAQMGFRVNPVLARSSCI